MADQEADANKTRALTRTGTLNKKHPDVRDELFHEEDFFDPRDLLQVKYEMLRRVRTDHWPVTRAAAAYGFSRFAYYDAAANFSAQGLAGLLPRKKGPRHSHKLSGEVLQFLDERLDEKPYNAEELASMLSHHFALEVHPRSIGRAMARWKKKRWRKPG